MRLSIVYLLAFLINIAFITCKPRLEKLTSNNLADKQQLHTTSSKKDSSNILPIDLRSLTDWKLTSLLLVSDIDGNLHGLDRSTGSILWTLPIQEPLVRIQTNNSVENPQSNILWFVEPYEYGSLYYFTPKFGLNKLPASIRDLVMESPFSLNGDDKIYTGTRRTSLYNVNIQTGEIESSFGDSEVCPTSNIYSSQRNKDKKTIMIGKTTYELSIYSKENTNIVWNVTFSQWGPNNIDNDLIVQNQQSLDNVYFTPFHDKSILAINRDLGTPLWISKLPSLAVNVFDIFLNTLKSSEYVLLPHPLKVLNDDQSRASGYSENNDMIFINKTSNNNEWFAMSFENYPTLIKSAPISEYQLSLYKLQNNIPVDIEYLKNFQLLSSPSSVVEKLINGVHKIFHLSSDTSYQPISRFDDPETSVKRISDGGTSSEDIKNERIPNIIDSIKFSNELSLREDNYDLELVNSFKEIATRPPHILTTQVEPLTMTKRILEDIIVLLSIFGFLVLFNKTRNYIRNYKLRTEDNANPNDFEVKFVDKVMMDEPSELTKDLDGKVNDKFDDILTKQYEVLNTESGSENYHKGNSSVDDISKTKKVTILVPDDPLIKDNLDYQERSDSNESSDESSNKHNDIESQTKKKRKRGSRGGKRGGKKSNKSAFNNSTEIEVTQNEEDEIISTTSLVKSNPPKALTKKLQVEKNLIISDKILGYGSHGTIVYQGTFENRPVAVKRMLLDFYDIANHEVSLLQESDDHPNVIRYFCSQSSDSEKFLYIALELCLCSLEDIIEKPTSYSKELRIGKDHKTSVLKQLVNGLSYLHSLKIVHRDLKPQNILVADLKNSKTESSIRLLISDFGLCKKLDTDQSSFRATTQNAASGTSGWRAPELLLNHDLLEISPDTISSIGSTSRHSINAPSGSGKRLTKAIDIFSLGCLFYYILSDGQHPYGDRYLREGNIIKGEYDLVQLKSSCPQSYVEATDLISSMINFNPNSRPDTVTISKHPFFWNAKKRLEFLLKVSDRFEVEQRDPPSDLLVKLETSALAVHQGNWHAKLDVQFMENLGKYRKYSADKLMDLLRAIRNKYHHYNDLPLSLQQEMNPLPDGFYRYFNSKFPSLLMEIYYVVEKDLKHEHIFEEFY